MPDARERPEPWKETEERGRGAQAEREALTLAKEVAAREQIAEHERTRARRVDDRDAGLELPAAGQQRRQVDPGLPVDPCFERASVQHPPSAAQAIGQIELLTRIRRGVEHGNAVGPVPAADSDGGLNRHVRDAIAGEDLQGIELAERIAWSAGDDHCARDVKRL